MKSKRLVFMLLGLGFTLAVHANDIIEQAGGTVKSGRAGTAVDLSKKVQYGFDGTPRIIQDAKITKAVVDELKAMDNLVALTVTGIPVTKNLELMQALPALTTLRALNLSNSQMSNEFMPLIVGMQALELVKLDDCRELGDAGIMHLADLPVLRELSVQSTQLTDEGLGAFANHLKLQKMNLRFTKVKGSGLSHLALIPTLTDLDMGADRSTADAHELDFSALANGFNRLTSFTIGGNKLNDNHLAALAKCETLERLSFRTIGFLQFSDAGLGALSSLKGLKEVNLNGAKDISDKGIETLCANAGLEKLNLQRTGVTGASVPHLAGLANLKELNLAGTRFDPAAAQAIQAKLPKAKIILHQRLQ